MIQIRKQKNHLTVKGHAGYAPVGYDIVCAMVSCLMWTFIDSCNEGDIKYTAADGEMSVSINRETPELKARIDMLMTGLAGIASEFPEYITVESAVNPDQAFKSINCME